MTPDEQRVLDAIRVVQEHLDSEWIAEGCRDRHAFGCTSCQAVNLREQLGWLAVWLKEDEDDETAALKEQE